MQEITPSVKHVGIVVSDADKAAEHWEAFGASEFRKFYLSTSKKTCGKVFREGLPCAIEARVAIGELNGMEIELLQPLDDQSVYYDFLKEHGDGLHHLCIDTGEVPFDEVNAKMKSLFGEPIFSGEGARMIFAYYDGRSEIGSFVEICSEKPSLSDL